MSTAKKKKAEKPELRRPDSSKAAWVTKEGKIMTVGEMDDRHLVNSMRLLERRAAEARLQNSELASYAATAEELAAKIFPVYVTMHRELEYRLKVSAQKEAPAEIIGQVGRSFDFGSN